MFPPPSYASADILKDWGDPMLVLPKKTEFNQRVPKEKFYANLNLSPALKRFFKENIRLIYWRNTISPATANLAPGATVNELQVLEFRLNSPQMDEAVLRQIDKELPYHILFLLEHNKQYQAWIGYKEASAGANAFKVSGYYHTDWMPFADLSLTLEGLNMDAVYEGFVRQLAGNVFQSGAEDQTLQQTVQRSERKAQLEKQIAALQAKMRKEPQLNRQMEINQQIKKLRTELK